MVYLSAETPGVEARLSAHITATLGCRVRRLVVERVEGGIVLRGNAESFYAKQLAQNAVGEVTDLPVVANRIAVCWVERGGRLAWAGPTTLQAGAAPVGGDEPADTAGDSR